MKSDVKLTAIDGGYGQIKGVSDEVQAKFLAVVGEPSSVSFKELMNVGKQTSILTRYKGVEHIVGDDAVSLSINPRFNTKNERVTDLDEMLKLLSMVHILHPEDEVTIDLMLGLPVLEYSVQKDAVVTKIPGEYDIEFFNGNDSSFWKSKKIIINKVKVLPQGVASIYDEVLDDQGVITESELIDMVIAGVDIGFRTTDLICMNPNLSFSGAKSLTIPTGMKEVYQELQKRLLQDRNIRANLKLVDMPKIAKDGYIKVNGKHVDVKHHIKAASEPVAQVLISSMRDLWGDFRFYDRLYLTGGGGSALADFFEPLNSETKVITAKFPEYGNALGLYKYGLFLKRKGRL